MDFEELQSQYCGALLEEDIFRNVGSGYAVKFIDLTREQQMDVISRTCHAAL